MSLIQRRTMLRILAASGLGSLARPARSENAMLPFENGERPVVAYPQKRPLLRLTARPPQLETPFAVFDESVLTPNDAFFVRYHLAAIPVDQIAVNTFKLTVQGNVERPATFTLEQLRAMPHTEIVAVNQCSGNSRGFFQPRVAGGQIGNGAMGNARWHGVALKTVLDRCGVRAGSMQVRFDGMDGPVIAATPDFAKAIDLDLARDGEVMLAWEMNGEELPMLNGFPLRVIVPGYYGTYWVKHVNEITVLEKPLANFWMATAYRVPDTDCACVEPGTMPAKTRPIGKFNVRSFITSVQDGGTLKAGAPVMLRGIAFDGGTGIKSVEVSTDAGSTWNQAALGEDLGKYSFRPWTLPATMAVGPAKFMVRATSNGGETQPTEQRWNPAGYMRNVVETISVVAS